MIKYVIGIFLVLNFAIGNAQIQVGSAEIMKPLGAPGKIKDSEYEALKKTTTLFTLQFADYDQEAIFEAAIKRVWTVTPFKIISPSEIGQYAAKPGYSFFTFGGYMITTNHNGMANDYRYLHYTYDLWMPNPKKKNGDRWLFGRYYVYTDYNAYTKSRFYSNTNNKKFSSMLTEYMYNDALIYNWGPAYLIGYLKEINDCLIAEETRNVFDDVSYKQSLKSLAKDTLYVPDYVNIQFNMFSGAEKVDDEKDDELSEAYKFPIRFVTTAELSKLILDESRSIKYLVYTRSGSYKWVSVFESGTGKMLYTEKAQMSYNFKRKDLRKIAKLID